VGEDIIVLKGRKIMGGLGTDERVDGIGKLL